MEDRTGWDRAVEMMEWQRDNAVTVEQAAALKPEERDRKILIGVLADRDLPIYQEEYDRIRDRAKETIGR